ncbi:TetR/AcrR family transcriptional regulator [Streptomyces lancefieldiae]|uniref:TetR/AcrR family transcriptional regulator n=1 Tax=Streptomyces lancefieldiae TaxID=3075520 RepID=A0ABU3ATJ4_9ACTN|nr:TetR/AcrR family transcriptional regulator [Streptomyces sp. DSM 40712]MDT0612151.1 TetR/AcrR family transcriptional regulator [Streptomyces sp. DSM 40712]
MTEASTASRAGGSLREAQKRLTRERLVDAAFEAFRDRGYAAVTAAHIASAAGASRATFYLHFPSKAEVVIALLERIEPTVVAFHRSLDESDPSLESVREWLDRAVAWWERDRLRFEAFEQALAIEPKVAARWFESVHRAADAMPRHLAAFTEGPDRDRERLRLVTLITQLERLMYFTAVRQAPHDREQLVDVLAEQWWDVLKQS